jgi:hypothetical protein
VGTTSPRPGGSLRQDLLEYGAAIVVSNKTPEVEAIGRDVP